MSRILDQLTFFDQPFRLSDEQRENPYTVLEDFFSDYRLGDLRSHFEEVSEICLICDGGTFDKAEKRAELLTYQKKIEILLEAAYLITVQKVV